MKSFNAKILLFGEYAVLYGSKVIAVPYSNYSGQFCFNENQQNTDSNNALTEWCSYLLDHPNKNIDAIAFKNDLEKGLAFKSTIPNGYGLGSSGALVAAFYNRYGINNTDKIDLLIQEFQNLESFFHGKSSGIDPLVSYLNKNLLIDANRVEEQLIPSFVSYELINSYQKRNTLKCVDSFKLSIQESEIKAQLLTEYIELNNQLIESIVSDNYLMYVAMIKKISQIQFHLFDLLIPPNIKLIWEKSFSENYCIKLCGAGGGGYFLKFNLPAA